MSARAPIKLLLLTSKLIFNSFAKILTLALKGILLVKSKAPQHQKLRYYDNYH